MKKILFLLSLLFALNTAWAAGPAAIKIDHPWARESPPTVTNGAVYMTLINESNQPDRLVGASGKVAKTIQLHTHIMENNMMKMRPVEAIEINPGEPTVLQPGGLHIMLLGLEQPLVAGQTFTLNLQFEKAGAIPVEVTVTKESPMHHHHGSPGQ